MLRVPTRLKEYYDSRKMNLILRWTRLNNRAHESRPEQPWKFEIIIPTYNHVKYLEKSWKSAIHQDIDSKYLVTVVNDCSTDPTEILMDKLKQTKTLKNVQTNFIKNKENMRQHGSLNSAIAKSGADIIVILNDDDVLTPDALKMIRQAFLLNPDVFLVGSTSIWFNEDAKTSKLINERTGSKKLTIYQPDQVKSYRRLNDLNMTQTSSAFFKCAWKSVGGYRDKNNRIHPHANEDRDFQMRVNACYSVGVYNDWPLALWRTDSSHGKEY